MRRCICAVLGWSVVIVACLPVDQNPGSNARAITVDGSFIDWKGLDPAVNDSRGETTAAELDFGSLWISNDQHALHLRFEVGRETIWQNEAGQVAGNDIRIYLDTDADVLTGKSIGDLGVDYELHLGSKFAVIHDADGDVELDLNQVGLTVGPSHSAVEFELRIPFDLRTSQTEVRRIIGNPAIRLMIWEGSDGDRLPDSAAVSYEIASEQVAVAASLSLDRMEPDDLRILSHNIHYNRPADEPGPFRRYLKALRPDVVNFQEVWIWDAQQTKKFVTDVLDPGNEAGWFATKVEDCVTVSRWPIEDSAAVDGNLVCRINLPDDLYSNNLILFNAHTPCCGHNDGRDYEHDHIAATWRDLLENKGPFPIDAGDSVILAGDFNMVGFARQLASIREGAIHSNELFGRDFKPDPEMGSLTVAPLRHTHSRAIYSWRNDADYYPPGRLDYILFEAGRLILKNNFTLYTPDIPEDVLDKYEIQSSDSLISDHLVLVADFEFK